MIVKAPFKVNRVRAARLLLSLSIALLPSVSAYAQSTFATVQGTVLDLSGAIIPDAIITIKDEDTGTTENGSLEWQRRIPRFRSERGYITPS